MKLLFFHEFFVLDMKLYRDILKIWRVYKRVGRTYKKLRTYWHNSKPIDGYCDAMSPYDYEHFCARQFLQAGWDYAQATSGGSDQGVDVVAERKKDNVVLAVQCKKYMSKNVGNDAVQQVVAGMALYNANEGAVITNSTFTDSAIELAKANNILLLHHSQIKDL